jgi:hypothetical protein
MRPLVVEADWMAPTARSFGKPSARICGKDERLTLRGSARKESGALPQLASRFASVFCLMAGLLVSLPAHAQLTLGGISLGAGLQTMYEHDQPTKGSSDDQFLVTHARIYISGPVYQDLIKFTFNTDYDSATNKIGVMDAIAQFSVSPQVNIWAGRFLPPGDRSNLYGPFYSNELLTYTDSIQDGYPSIFQGRDDGAMWWGDFSKLKVSAGAFDGRSLTGNAKVLAAARAQYDFWDKEEGYYQNGTYYGDKNVLALGLATQVQSGHTASTIDFLLEKKVGKGGAFTIESEFGDYNRLGGYQAAYAKSEGAYGLASYLFPKEVPFGKYKGKFELLGKYAKAEFTHGTMPSYDQKTTEINFDYVIKQFNARIMSFFEDQRFNRVQPNTWHAGIGLQIQM